VSSVVQDRALAQRPRRAAAFAPAAITNFFAIVDGARAKETDDLWRTGATGGGYVLSEGVTTRATVLEEGDGSIQISVDGDPKYPARTTERAVRLLLNSTGTAFGGLLLDQSMEVPVGSGFGASAASALSAVIAVSAALGLSLSREQVAYFAHKAEILNRTGLGTVSVAYDAVGAGAITEAGGPGVAKFLPIPFPEDLRIVTASLAPFSKPEALASPRLRERINRLGGIALQSVRKDPSLDSLAAAGERFAAELALMNDRVAALIALAKRHGAVSASQNMIGQSMHAIIAEGKARGLASTINALDPALTVRVFRISETKAGVVPDA
jgi:pantoate kinase